MSQALTYEAFLLLLTQDEVFSKSIAAQMDESDQHPEAFFTKKYKQGFLRNWGIKEPGHPKQTLGFILETLVATAFLYELYWKVDFVDLNYTIFQMTAGEIQYLLNEEDEENVDDMFQLIEVAQDRLKPFGLGLIQFSFYSDIRCIGLVPLEQLLTFNHLIDKLFDQSPSTMKRILRTSSDNPDFVALVRQLDAYLAEKDGEEHAYYAQYNKIDELPHVIVLYQGNTPLGCGAIKVFDDQTMEVKRMYVVPSARGQGLASEILEALEIWTKELGHKRCILETGQRQTEAVILYERRGYQRIPNYGQYVGMDNSICFEKNILNT